MNTEERYADVIHKNLKNFPTIEKFLKKSIDKWIGKGLPYYLEQPLIRSIYLDERRNSVAERFEKVFSIVTASKNINVKSKISRLNQSPETNFDEFASELRAAYYLLKLNRAQKVIFSTMGEHYDISYLNKYDNKEYYVEVESLISLDPYHDIFLNKLSAKAICDLRYNRLYELLYKYPQNERVITIHEESQREISKVIQDLDYEFQKGNFFSLPIVDDNCHTKYNYLKELNFRKQTNHKPEILSPGRTMAESTIMRNLIPRVIDHCDDAYFQIKKQRNGNVEDNDLIVICLNFEDFQFYSNNLEGKLNKEIDAWRSSPKKNIQVKLLE